MNEINDRVFWDSNLWIYLFVKGSSAKDQEKQSILLNLLKQDNFVYSSAQVLNEVGNVLLRKYNYSETDTRESFEVINELSEVAILSKKNAFQALQIKKRYNFNWFDCLIISSALACNCSTLYTEDLHHGLILDDNKLTLINPFKEPPNLKIRQTLPAG